MFGLDDHIAHLGAGEAFLLVAVVAVLLGLRHATDPDHLTAVSTLVAGDRHELVACERCGASAPLAPRLARALRHAVRSATGFEARFSHLPLPGLCPRCHAATTMNGGHDVRAR